MQDRGVEQDDGADRIFAGFRCVDAAAVGQHHIRRHAGNEFFNPGEDRLHPSQPRRPLRQVLARKIPDQQYLRIGQRPIKFRARGAVGDRSSRSLSAGRRDSAASSRSSVTRKTSSEFRLSCTWTRRVRGGVVAMLSPRSPSD